MKTIDLTTKQGTTVVTLQLDEFELTTLAALVEQGQRRLHGKHGRRGLHDNMTAVADQFRSLLGHLELLITDN